MEQAERWEVNFKRLTVKLSDGSTIAGKVNIRNFQRVSDFFRSADDRFITMVPDASQKVTMLNKSYIIWAETED